MGDKQPGLIMSAAGPCCSAKVVIWWTLSHWELSDKLNQSSLQCHRLHRSATGQLTGGCMGTREGTRHNVATYYTTETESERLSSSPYGRDISTWPQQRALMCTMHRICKLWVRDESLFFRREAWIFPSNVFFQKKHLLVDVIHILCKQQLSLW